jgi:serine protease Do/serine protease DegQ
VVEKDDEVAVTIKDGRTMEAELVGSDSETDLAVVRIPAEGLSELPLPDSDNLRVGDFVVAVGNPFGLGQSVTSGIVSALGRHGIGRGGMQDFIQTDAPINRGNSGGALVNLAGKLVGINAAILSPSGGNIGIGFAIPASMARQVMSQLLEHGEVRRGTLGLDAQSLTRDLAEALGLDRDKGAVVTQVQAGSPAEKAGLKASDVVISVNGKTIADRQDLRNALGLLPVGETVELTILREGKRQVLKAKIRAPESIRVPGKRLDPRLEGAVLGDVPPELRRKGLEGGIAVPEVERGSPAWEHGLRPGDVILSVNRARIPDLSAFQKLMQDPPRRMLLNVLRGNGALFVLIE